MQIDWSQYPSDRFYDELIAQHNGQGMPRDSAQKLCRLLSSLDSKQLAERKLAAELAIKTLGISFTVYTEAGNIDRDWPYDLIPRIIPYNDWHRIHIGLEQRLKALNLFITDIYNDQKIIKDKIFPAEILAKSKNFRPECQGIKPLFDTWAHICGTDLIRDEAGQFFVLEDNLRVPSGVSYMMENRKITKRIFPEMFEDQDILPIADYPAHLFDTLAAISPRPLDYPEIVVLTPGIYNSAYFEHSYLAQQMGVELVEGSDLVVENDFVYMRSVDGLTRVDVIYRRIDDLFLDPLAFNKDSLLGVPGLMRAWQKGNVALANAPGAGVADDKVVYTFVPNMIRYYLNEEPVIENVPSYLCMDPKQCEHVLSNIDKLVVKPANESGGYGMLIGPQASKAEQDDFKARIKADPRNYMAQPLVSLSTAPILTHDNAEPRHLDLRPFTLQARETKVTAGGLTRVAMQKGSFVVNSSQGGGSKDTWIVR